MIDLFHQPKEEIAEIKTETEGAIMDGMIGANAKWRDMAIDCLEQIALSRQEFTTNDVRAMVSHSPLRTHDNRAMGGVIKHGVSMKWIIATGKTMVSRVGHGGPLQIWKSLIFKKS